MDLIQFSSKTHEVQLKLAYASSDNFTHKAHYAANLNYTYLHKNALCRLEKVLEGAAKLNLRLNIWDAFRPIEVQKKLWDCVPDERYVSHPDTGEVTHCRGIAIDVTLIDAAGNYLDMGADFDDFSNKSHLDCLTISSAAYQNRVLLAGLMHIAGFECKETEWWHFQLPNQSTYPIIKSDETIRRMLI